MKLSTLDKICCFLSELLGTALLVFLGCMGCVKTVEWTNNRLLENLNFGLVNMMIIQSFGCISGAYLNPSVTLAAYIYKKQSLPMTVFYVIAECLGGFLGYGLLKIALPAVAVMSEGMEHGLCMTVPHSAITTYQTFIIEFVITGVLIAVNCGVWDPRNAKNKDSAPLIFGLTITCLSLTAGSFTGASMNPARSLGPAIWNNDFTDHWIYWAAPLLSACLTSLAYKAVFRREVEEEKPIINKLRHLEEIPFS